MAAVCLMQLLPDDIITQIIIHSMKDEHVFHFLNLHNKICSAFGAFATPMRYYYMCRYMIFVGCARIVMTGRALSDASARPTIWRHYASRGWRG
jgi:hypothetical protein